MAKINKPKKILIALYYYAPYVSGVSVYAKNLAEGLVKAGHEVTVLTSRFEKSLPKKTTINGVLVLRRPVLLRIGKGVIMPFFWFDVVRYSRRNDYVNAHLPMPDTGMSSLLVPKRKMVTTYQCDIKLESGFVNKLILLISFILMNIQLKRSKSIVVLSKDYFTHSKMNKYLKKARPIYPLIPTSEFKKTDSSQLVKKLGLTTSQTKIGFVGRIVFEKGIRYLLRSIPFLEDQIEDFKIIIVGDYKNIAGGSIKDELDIYVEKYPNRIIFTGYLSDVDLRDFYSMVDVLVLPSIDPLEAFGIVQVEAMLCGTPVIASDLPGVREVIRKTGYGLLCRPKDPKDIALKISEVVRNKEKYLPNRNIVAKVFNPDETIMSYLDIMT